MKKPSDSNNAWDEKRSSVIGLGERSLRKSYYPQLQNRIVELEKFKDLINKISDSIFILRLPDCIIEEVNNSASDLLELKRHELINSSMFKILSNAESHLLKKWIEISSSNQIASDFSISSYILNKSKIKIPVEIRFNTREYNSERYCIAVMRDITERKKSEQALIEALEQAELADKLKTEFLAQMSHEIRTPVNTLLSNSDLLFDELKNVVSEELRSIFESMNKAGSRLIRTIDLILNMSQFQTGQVDIKKEDFSLSDYVNNSLFMEYDLKAKAKGLTLNKEIKCSDTSISADKYSIGQILDNLLDNAIKYTEEGEVNILIDRTEKEHLYLEVSDTGIGIADEYMQQLFEPFSQEEQGYTRKFEGNGLGLALVKKYCDLNNAHISVESKKNIGSVFTVVFT